MTLTRAIALLLSVTAPAMPGVASARVAEGADERAIRQPVTAAEIAAAVGECLAKGGDAGALRSAGWTPLDGRLGNDEMVAYRRGDAGAVLILPRVENPLRCWIMGNPADDKAAVIEAISTKIGATVTDRQTPGWTSGGYTLVLDWSTDTDTPRFYRVEVYKLPQEKK